MTDSAVSEPSFDNGTIAKDNDAGYGQTSIGSRTDDNTQNDNDTSSTFTNNTIVGRLVKKRKYPGPYISLAIKVLSENVIENGNTTDVERRPPMLIFVSKQDPALKRCHVDSWVQVDVISTPSGQTQTTATTETTDVAEKRRPGGGDNRSTFVNSRHALGTHLQLVKCAPNPSVIPGMLSAIREGDVPLEVISYFAPSLQHDWQIDDILDRTPQDRDRKQLINVLCQELHNAVYYNDNNDDDSDHDDENNNNGNRTINSVAALHDNPRTLMYGNGVSARATRLKKRHLEVLDRLESTIPLVEVVQNNDESISMKTSTMPWEISNNGDDDNTNNNKMDIGLNNKHNVLNIPGNDLSLKSFRHPRSRYEYLQDKKWPQINWLLNRLKRFDKFAIPSSITSTSGSESLTDNPTEVVTVLDVGGGRGDIACAIAKRFLTAHVTIVDENLTSLEAGRTYAKDLGVDDRTNFVCADFQTYAKTYVENHTYFGKAHRNHDYLNESSSGQEVDRSNGFSTDGRTFDLVVAWHACGDLSDIALQFASDIGASYVVCPCCYTKERLEGFIPSWIGNYLGTGDEMICHEIASCPSGNDADRNTTEGTTPTSMHLESIPEQTKAFRRDEINAIQKLAETNDRPEVSRRAMTVINSMRMQALAMNMKVTTSNSQTPSSRHIARLESYPLEYSSKNLVLVNE